MKTLRPLRSLTLVVLLSTTAFAAETQTLYYPMEDDALFSIEVPPSWKVSAIEKVGDFGTLEGENGAVLQFRAVRLESAKSAEEEVSAAADSLAEFLQKTYEEVNLNDPEDITGDHPGSMISGAGKDKNGNPVCFLSAIIVLDPTTIAEIWCSFFPEDDAGSKQAVQIIDSFKPTGT